MHVRQEIWWPNKHFSRTRVDQITSKLFAAKKKRLMKTWKGFFLFKNMSHIEKFMKPSYFTYCFENISKEIDGMYRKRLVKYPSYFWWLSQTTYKPLNLSDCNMLTLYRANTDVDIETHLKQPYQPFSPTQLQSPEYELA